ncbi:MAG: hypothetical protein ABR915_25135, partial [Thermoguttaceae bacterium]
KSAAAARGGRPLPLLLAIVAAWFLGWGTLNSSFMGPIEQESVVFFALLGLAVAYATLQAGISDQPSPDMWKGAEPA